MFLLIEEKEIDSLPITIDPEVLSGTPVFQVNASAGGCATR
jgi:hypothetical protein